MRSTTGPGGGSWKGLFLNHSPPRVPLVRVPGATGKGADKPGWPWELVARVRSTIGLRCGWFRNRSDGQEDF